MTSTANARSGRTAATSAAAVGGPGWLYGQARNWATRDSTSPPPRTWAQPRTSAASPAGNGGSRIPAGGNPWAGNRTGNGSTGRSTAAPQLVSASVAPTNSAAAPAGPTFPGRRRIGDAGFTPNSNHSKPEQT